MARKGVVKEHLLLIVSATTQVALLRRVSCVKLQLRDRQEARRSTGGRMTDPYRWRGDGAWMRLRV